MCSCVCVQCSGLPEKANAVENVSYPGHEITMRLCDLIMLTHKAFSSSTPHIKSYSLSLSPRSVFPSALLSSLINTDTVCLPLALYIHAHNLISIILLTIPEQLIKICFQNKKCKLTTYWGVEFNHIWWITEVSLYQTPCLIINMDSISHSVYLHSVIPFLCSSLNWSAFLQIALPCTWD